MRCLLLFLTRSQSILAARGHSPRSCEISLGSCELAEGRSDDLFICNAKFQRSGGLPLVIVPPHVPDRSVQREKFVPVGGASLFHALNGKLPKEMLAIL